jgi:L-alanine-DL-glutamate epimerase-like enolase superfamily enzyme
MKITRIEAIPFAIPMRHVVKFATGQLARIEHVLVRIETDQGLVGCAEAPARPMVYGESTQSIVAAIQNWFGPALEGLDPFAIEQVWARLDRVEHNPTAKGAIDIALYDIIGQAAGVPCWRLLGGWGNRVRLSHILGLGSPEEVAEQALTLRAEHGFTAFKLKAGLDPAGDTAMVRAVRRALGDAFLLHVDVNHGYASHVALRTVPEWEASGIAWVEEPCPGHDQRGRALIARATRLPLMADESCITPSAVAAEIRHGACRFMSVKTARTGFTLSRRILALCGEDGMATVIGSQGDSDFGALASAHFCAAHRQTAIWPGELSFFLDMTEGLLAEPLVIHDGHLVLSDRPGLGITIDEARLARLRLDA